MGSFRLQFLIHPSAPFGLPDGDKVVLPAGPRSISGPVIDTRTGEIANHGTLPIYRTDEEALKLDHSIGGARLVLHDNFAGLWIDSVDVATAHRDGKALMERVCQSLSTLYGFRFRAAFQFIEDDTGNPKQVVEPRMIDLGSFTTFNLGELAEKIGLAFHWAESADATVRKALLYAEHACLLSEYAEAGEKLSAHASFSRSLAFLQLFKALTTIIGDPSSDKDHQRRFRKLGLPADFWEKRVRPLYKIRNDDDVAHYSVEMPDLLGFATTFGQAMGVLRDALAAYVTHIPPRRDG